MSDEVVTTTKIFDRGKTTIPAEIRGALGLTDGDKVKWMKDKFDRFYIENTKKTGVRYTVER